MKTLKKYSNRRIYDTEQKAFVKISEIRQMVLNRESFRVISDKSGKDLTRSILIQIIAEQESEGHESLLTNRVLEELIRFFDDKMVAILSPYLEQQILHSIAIQDQLRDQISQAFTQPYPGPEQAMKQMVDQYEAYTKAFAPQPPAGADTQPYPGPEQAIKQMVDHYEAYTKAFMPQPPAGDTAADADEEKD